MALSYAAHQVPRERLGRRAKYYTDITFDSSYASGGESVDAQLCGARKDRSADIVGMVPIGGNPASHQYTFLYDTTNKKLRAYQRNAAALVVEEVVTIASHIGTLARIPGYILTVEATAGSSTGSKRVIPVGETPGAGQVAVNFLTGGLTFNTSDAVTSVRISYIPLGVGPFIEANRVIDESNTGTNDTSRDLANRAALIQYIWNDTDGNLPTIVPVGESPGSGAIDINIVNSSNTTFNTNAAQDDATFKITYWKYSALAAYGFTDQGDITVTSDAIIFPEVLDISSIFIPAFGQVIVGETGASANLQATMVGPSGTAAANVAVFDPAKNTLSLYSSDSYGTIEMPYILLNAAMVGGLTEVAAGTDLSAVTITVEVTTL